MPAEIDLIIVYGAEEAADEMAGGLAARRLADALSADIVNLATAGASNRHLVRTVILETADLIRSRGVHPERVLVILVWTEVDRFEVQAAGSPGSSASGSDDLPSPVQLSRALAEAGDRQSDAWYRMYHPAFGASELLLFLVLLERWLAAKGIRWLHVFDAGVEAPTDAFYDRYRSQVTRSELVRKGGGLALEDLSATLSVLADGTDSNGSAALDHLTAGLAGQQPEPGPVGRHPEASPVRLVVVNGDSNTWGSDHADPTKTCWGSVLAERLDAEVVNMSERGGSNHRLLRTTVEHLGRIAAERDVAPEEVLFVGMWTFPDWFEMTTGARSRQAVHEPRVNDGSWHRIFPYSAKLGFVPSRVWYEELDGKDQGSAELLLWTILLDRWLEAFGCRHLLALAYDHILSESACTLHPRLMAQLPEDGLAGGDQWSQLGFRGIFAERSLHGPLGHLQADAHRQYVDEYLLPWLNGRV